MGVISSRSEPVFSCAHVCQAVRAVGEWVPASARPRGGDSTEASQGAQTPCSSEEVPEGRRKQGLSPLDCMFLDPMGGSYMQGSGCLARAAWESCDRMPLCMARSEECRVRPLSVPQDLDLLPSCCRPVRAEQKHADAHLAACCSCLRSPPSLSCPCHCLGVPKSALQYGHGPLAPGPSHTHASQIPHPAPPHAATA